MEVFLLCVQGCQAVHGVLAAGVEHRAGGAWRQPFDQPVNQKALPVAVKPAIIAGFPECVQGDLTRRAVISAPVGLPSWRCFHDGAVLQPRGFKRSSPELNLKE